MALYHKWGVKTGFTFVLQLSKLISDGLAGVCEKVIILAYIKAMAYIAIVNIIQSAINSKSNTMNCSLDPIYFVHFDKTHNV